ncbi:hypothetical protein C6Y56_28835 [Pseudomonas fluorescens]|uniref:Uncharacterized protein n=1 Tax=Pseudomonas fluorescens TaxID=294 RepID=A0A7Z3CAD7_PSEFL|nr:hypothetical protein C6Y56_28835 [Pseudomonas fluorescens]
MIFVWVMAIFLIFSLVMIPVVGMRTQQSFLVCPLTPAQEGFSATLMRLFGAVIPRIWKQQN